MTNCRFLTFLFAIIVLLCGNICLAQKITIDPNTGPAVPEVTQSDTRLAQKITYEAWHTPIKSILADLSRKTNVTFYAGYNVNDWQVRDRKMNIYVKDVTLAQLMNSIARVMRFKWSINNEKTPFTYRLIADRRLLVKLQAEASKRENELKNEQIRRRTRLVNDFARVANLSDSEMQALKESNPYLYLCASTHFADFMTHVFEEKPAIRNAFVSADDNILLRAKLLSQSTQQIYADTVFGNWPFDRISNDTSKPYDGLRDNVRLCTIHMGFMPSPFETSILGGLSNFGGVSTLTSKNEHRLGSLKDPYSKSTQTWAKAFLTAADREMGQGDFYKEFYPEIDSDRQKDTRLMEYYLMFDPVITHEDEPDLHKKVQLIATKDTKDFKEALMKNTQNEDRVNYQLNLRIIADAAKLNIVSDSYAVIIGEFIPEEKEKELKDVLDSFADGYRCNWEKHGDILEIRRMDWFRRRGSQIPDSWLEPWQDEIKRTGTITLDTYFQMISLSDDQIEENLYDSSQLRQFLGASWSYENNKGFARFYQQLNSSQRSQMFSEQGLDPYMLSPTQWPYYSEMFCYGARYVKEGSEQFSDSSVGKVVVNAEKPVEQSGGMYYKFNATLTKNDGGIVIEFWEKTLPLPPKKDDGKSK